MINKVNHRNGITLPNGDHYEARVGSTRWFNAERAERALSEVRPEVDRAVELVNRAFNTADTKGAFEAIIEIIETGLDLKAVGIYSCEAPGSMTADMMKWGNCSEEMIAGFIENWQNVLSKLERKGMIEETAVKTAMALVIRGHWGFWSKNGWFVKAEMPEVVELEVAEVAEEQVENEQSSENNEAEEVKAEVEEVEEEEVSTGRQVARMFDPSNPERAFAAMLKIVSGGFNIQKVLGFSFSKMNVGGKVINTNQVAYEVMNKNVTPEFRNAAVAAWKSLLDRAERLHRYAADTAEALGVEVENEPEEVEEIEQNEQSSENKEVKVNQERLSDECVANVGGCRVQANTPEDMRRIDGALRCLRAVLNDEETLDGFLEMAGRQRFFLRAKTEDLSSFLLAESGKETRIRKNGNYTWAARKDGAVLEVWVQGSKGVLWWRNTLRE